MELTKKILRGNLYSIVFVAFAFIASPCCGERKPATSSGGGLEEWIHTWGGSYEDRGFALSLDGSGNVYVAGITYSFGAGVDDVLLLKYSSSGELLWQKTWGGGHEDRANALSLDGSGKIYLAGTAWNSYRPWGTPSGTETFPSGLESSPSGTQNNVSGTEGSPSGIETEPNGIQDEGGGLDDALVMKLYPQ